MHYFADHKYLPYGSKPSEFIISRIQEIGNYLNSCGCELIVVACHSASSVLCNHSLDFTWQGVVSPTIDYLKKLDINTKVGVIGTEATINSKVYQNLSNLNIKALATPKLAYAIEHKHQLEIEQEVRLVLSLMPDIEYLVLACTHYPFIQNEFLKISPDLKIIDTPALTYEALKSKITPCERATITIESSQANQNFLELAKLIFKDRNIINV